jgi:putative endonuclease
MAPCVYILANRKKGFLYIGVTNDIRRRLTEHRMERSRHTARYSIRRLVYIEPYDRIVDAIKREKQLKNWRRQWKINLIETVNPEWRDLSQELSWFD